MSESIYKKSKNNSLSNVQLVQKFFHARNEVFKNDHSQFLKNSSDTIFLIEGYDIQSGQVISTIWNRNGEMNYKYYPNKLEIVERRNYDYSLMSEVEKGRTLKFSRSPLWIYMGVATRIIKIKDQNDFIVTQFPFEY